MKDKKQSDKIHNALTEIYNEDDRSADRIAASLDDNPVLGIDTAVVPPIEYAIPPQQKQGDEWEEIYRGVQEKFGTPSGNYFQTYATVGEVIQYIKTNLTKK